MLMNLNVQFVSMVEDYHFGLPLTQNKLLLANSKPWMKKMI